MCKTCHSDHNTIKSSIISCAKCPEKYHQFCFKDALKLPSNFAQLLSMNPCVWWLCPSCAIPTNDPVSSAADNATVIEFIREQVRDMKSDLVDSIDSKLADAIPQIRSCSQSSYASKAAAQPVSTTAVISQTKESKTNSTVMSREVLVISPNTENTSEIKPLEEVAKSVSKKLSNVAVSFTATNDVNKKITLGFTDCQTRDQAMSALSADSFLQSAGFQCKSSNKMLPKLTLFNVNKSVLDDLEASGIPPNEKKTLKDLISYPRTQVSNLLLTWDTLFR